jgi:Mn-containing catalase
MTNDIPYLDAAGASRRSAAGDTQPIRDAELAIAASLAEHGPREGAALAEYERLVESCDDEGIRYLAGMVLEDERRHHQMIREMLNQIQSYLWETDVEPQVPYLHVHHDPELRGATDRLLKLEREDAKELRKLRRQVKDQPSSSMLPLLVELMLHDTAKHVQILKLIRAHVTS